MLKSNNLIGFGVGGNSPLIYSDGSVNDITVPAVIQDGDIGILISGAYRTPPLNHPSGWTLVGDYLYSTYHRVRVHMKLLNDSDIGTILPTMQGDSSTFDASMLLIFRPLRVPEEILSKGFNALNNTVASTDLTGSKNTRLVIGANYDVNDDNAGTLTMSGLISDGYVDFNSNSRIIARFAFVDPSEEIGIVDVVATSTGFNTTLAFYIEIS